MNFNTVKVIIAFSLLGSLLWLIGLGWVTYDQFYSKPSNNVSTNPSTTDELKDDSAIHIVALGDSLTRGTGDQAGKGYVGYLIEELENKTDKEINLSNLAIKGQTSSQLKTQLQEVEINRRIKEADMIVMTIGGNDLFQGGEIIDNLSLNQIDESKEKYLKNLNVVFSEIQKSNPVVTIFHVGLYNPFYALNESQTTSQVVREWNYQSAEVASHFQNAVSVPTFDLFQLHVNDYLYSDQFHPNSEGYKVIAERLASLITFEEEVDKND